MSEYLGASGRPAFGGRLGAAAALGLSLLGLAMIATTPSRAGNVALSESGSTLLYSVFKVWAQDYEKTHSGVTITTAATGSQKGIEDALSGAAQVGASDAYMSDAESRRHRNIVNVAMAISAQTVNYNLPGLNDVNLRFDGPTLAAIYSGKIHTWDDKAIAALNPTLKLPSHAIIPIRRAEGSGDTFVFTQYLTFSTPSWEDSIGFGTTIAWPAVSGEVEATGNEGMIEKLQATPYSLGYVGVSYHDEIDKDALGTAALKSYDGEFLLPTPESIAAAAAGLGPRTPTDERLTLVNAPGANAYPLINYEYAIVSSRQPNAETAAEIRKFLLWATAPDEANQKYLDQAHFIALPAHIWVLSYDQIAKIK